MAADAAKLPPFRPLPYKAPDIEVTRGAGGVVYLRSRTPLGPTAALHPARARRARERCTRTGPG